MLNLINSGFRTNKSIVSSALLYRLTLPARAKFKVPFTNSKANCLQQGHTNPHMLPYLIGPLVELEPKLT